jgi:hypothetical protein
MVAVAVAQVLSVLMLLAQPVLMEVLALRPQLQEHL